MGDILMLMDIIMGSVRLRLNQKQKLTPTSFMVDIMVTILDMPDIMDIPMPIMESAKLNLRPRLRLTLLFSMVDTMDTTWDMLDTMDMLDIPMSTMDKLYFTTTVTGHRKTTIKSTQYLLPEHNISVLVSMTSRNRE